MLFFGLVFSVGPLPEISLSTPLDSTTTSGGAEHRFYDTFFNSCLMSQLVTEKATCLAV